MKVEKNKTTNIQAERLSSATNTNKEDGIKTTSIFKIDDKSKVSSQVQDAADEKLTQIADTVIEKNNNKISWTKRFGLFGSAVGILGMLAKNLFFKGPKASTGLVLGIAGLAFVTITGLVEFIGGQNKREAQYTKIAAKTKNKNNINFDLAENNSLDFMEKIGQTLFSSKQVKTLPQDKIAQNAPDALGKDNVKTRRIYFVDSKTDNQKAGNLMIVDAKINSAEYNGIKKDGIDEQHYDNIPVEYAPFINAYLDSKEISKEKTDKFIDIIKAFSTDGIFAKTQNKEKNDGRKEDVDLFDLSGDGILNYGDIAKINLYLKIQNGEFTTQAAESLNSQENWSTSKLSKIFNLTHEECEIFDLNGDGNIDSNDFNLYQKTLNNNEKLDINNDGKVDIVDANLTKSYFTAILKRYNNEGEFLDNTNEIMGGADKKEILTNFFKEAA